MVGVNFYVHATGEMLDWTITPRTQIELKMHYYIISQQRIYSVVLTKLTYQQPLICSLAVMIVQDTSEMTARKLLQRQWREKMPTNGDTQSAAAYWIAQLQAVVKYTEKLVRHAYLQALRSTCNMMNNVLRITEAAVMEHMIIAACRLLNNSFIRTLVTSVAVYPSGATMNNTYGPGRMFHTSPT